MPTILLMIAFLAAGHIGTKADNHKELDVAFVLDGSSSVCGGTERCDNWDSLLHLIHKIVEILKIGNDKTRVALITASNDVEVEWDFNKYSDKDLLLSAIRNVEYHGGEIDRAGRVQEAIRTVFSAAAGSRKDAFKLLIVITDGSKNVADENAATSANQLQEAGIEVLVVCITPGCTENFAKGMSSAPKEEGNTYFLVDGFSSLESVEEDIVERIHGDKDENR